MPTIPAMEESRDIRLTEFIESGIYRFQDSNTVFVDPVRVLNKSYTHFRISPSAYYSRFFPNSINTSNGDPPDASSQLRKRKRKKEKKAQNLNERELIAQNRHLELRPLLVKAHKDLLAATELLEALGNLRNVEFKEEESGEPFLKRHDTELKLVELGSVWQAPLYDFNVNLQQKDDLSNNEGSQFVQCSEQTKYPVFNNLVVNKGVYDMEIELLNNTYIVPGRCSFYMSDMKEIHNLIPAESHCGFNLILIDPPWENSSAHQKQKYQTLPNRYFLSLPIKQLMHTDGALVALWVTNREKLRRFVENDLFPEWGVKYAATYYWLKVKADGSLISELDLFHHRPYECLIIGYLHGKDPDIEKTSIHDSKLSDQIIISVPGDYSRKPPIQDLLLEYAPGLKPARCIELFARELAAGWTSWGNETLHFQHSKYFLNRCADS